MDDEQKDRKLSDELKYLTIRGEERQPLWPIYEALAALAFVLIFTIAISWLIEVIFPLWSKGLVMIVAAVIQTAALIFAAYRVVKKHHARPLAMIGAKSAPFFRVLGSGLSWGALLYFLSILVSLFVSQFYQGEEELQAIMRILAGEGSPLIRAGIVFTIIVLAPLGEEIFFRGFFYPAFRRHFGIKPAVAISGAVFAALHLDIVSFLPLFMVGMGLALIYQKYQNLWYNIIAHAVFNSISTVLFFIFIGSV